MIASFSIPQAVSKIMAERLAFKRYRDAQKIFKGALLYAVVVGGAVAIVCVAGAPILVPERMANARLALQFLAPTIFLSGILGVFRGYFQAYRNMLPTSISQIVEQTAVAVVLLLWLTLWYIILPMHPKIPCEAGVRQVQPWEQGPECLPPCCLCFLFIR